MTEAVVDCPRLIKINHAFTLHVSKLHKSIECSRMISHECKLQGLPSRHHQCITDIAADMLGTESLTNL